MLALVESENLEAAQVRTFGDVFPESSDIEQMRQASSSQAHLPTRMDRVSREGRAPNMVTHTRRIDILARLFCFRQGSATTNGKRRVGSLLELSFTFRFYFNSALT